MANGFTGERVGMSTLILLGDGVVANVVLEKSKEPNSGWIVIAVGWALAVLMGVIVTVSFGAPEHLNRVVTIAMAFLVLGINSSHDAQQAMRSI